MADVYEAFDERLHAAVAVKVLKPRLSSADLRARMLQEAHAAAALAHPHMLRVIDVASEADGTMYIAMELLAGSSLAQLLREHGGRLPWRRAVQLVLPILDALHAAHEQGFVHRDVKADNVFVARSAGGERPVLIDFGIAKAEPERRLPGGPQTTRVGWALGTPRYAAPEQLAGRPCDRRVDVYACGVTLYRAIAGRFPFDGHHDPAGVAPRLDAIVGDPTLPRALADAVARALAYAPDDRFPTARALALALAPQPAGGLEPAPARLRAAASVSALGLLGLVSWTMVARTGPIDQPAVAERPAVQDEPEVREPGPAAATPTVPASERTAPVVMALGEPVAAAGAGEASRDGTSREPRRTKPSRVQRHLRAVQPAPTTAATAAGDPEPSAPASTPSDEVMLASAWRVVEPVLQRCYAELGSVLVVPAELDIKVGASGQVVAVKFANPSLALMEPCVLRSLATARFPAAGAPRWFDRGVVLRPSPNLASP